MTVAPQGRPMHRLSLTGPADFSRLVRCLEQYTIPKVAGRRARIVHLRRSPSQSATSYNAEVVSVRLSDGTEMRFFLKDYGSSRRPRPAASQRRERELGVYRHLIGDGEIGTARYRGAVWDDGAAVHWLLLEFVAGTELRHMELRFWIEAARWLGRAQGRFAGSRLPSEVMPLLERHDARFFEAKAERARRSVSPYSPALARRLEAILERYEPSIDLIAGQEQSLVHGHYDAANILVVVDATPIRICPVDWELAALGSRFFDLASLCDGFQPPALHRIWDAYAEGAADAGLLTPARDRLRHLVDCFRLVRVIAWLGGAAEKRYSPSGVERLMARGETLAPLVES
ncbi:MAG TPA: aminoglycoside phosphotransferase family protein [Solirubrobacterales bacterium]